MAILPMDTGVLVEDFFVNPVELDIWDAHRTFWCILRDRDDSAAGDHQALMIGGSFQSMVNTDGGAVSNQRHHYMGILGEAALDIYDYVNERPMNSGLTFKEISSMTGVWGRAYLSDRGGRVGGNIYDEQVEGPITMQGGSFQAYPMSLNGGRANSSDATALMVTGVTGEAIFDTEGASALLGANIDTSFGGLFITGIRREEDNETGGEKLDDDSGGDALIRKAYGVVGAVVLADDDPLDDNDTQGEIQKAYAVYAHIDDPGANIGEAYAIYGVGDLLIGSDEGVTGYPDTVNDGQIDQEVFRVDTIDEEVTVTGSLVVDGQMLPIGGSTGANPTPRIEFDNDYYDDSGDPSVSHIDLYMGKFGFGVSYTGGNTSDLDYWANKRHCWQIYNSSQIDTMVLDQYGLELTEGLEVGKVVEFTGLSSDPDSTSGRGKIYAIEDINGTEMYAMDSHGNATPFSPHSFELFEPDDEDPLPWSYYSRNPFIGKEINVNMAAAIRAIEELTGEQFIYVRDLPAEEKVDANEWIEKQKQEKIIAAKKAALQKDPWVEIDRGEALEQVAEVKTYRVPITRTRYRVNPASGEVETYETRVIENITKESGKMVWRVKDGMRFDAATGKFYRARTLDEVEVDVDPQVSLPEYVMKRAK